MMKLQKYLFAGTLVILMIFPAAVFAEPVTINWWFAHGGRLGSTTQQR